MKTKLQKQEVLKKGEEMFAKSAAVLFIDFSKVKTSDLRVLRNDLKKSGNPLFILKKRLLGLIFKNKNLAFDDRQFKTSVGAVFASSLEGASSSVYKFFKGLEKEKKIDMLSAGGGSSPGGKILGGFDLARKNFMDAKYVTMIGALPPREILLAQVAMMIQAPLKQLMYVLDQKARSTNSG